jgi:hypothetical protein
MSQKPSIKPGRLSIALLVSSMLAAMVAQLFVAFPVRAECDYQGQKYQTGESRGPLTCSASGDWQLSS